MEEVWVPEAGWPAWQARAESDPRTAVSAREVVWKQAATEAPAVLAVRRAAWGVREEPDLQTEASVPSAPGPRAVMEAPAAWAGRKEPDPRTEALVRAAARTPPEVLREPAESCLPGRAERPGVGEGMGRQPGRATGVWPREAPGAGWKRVFQAAAARSPPEVAARVPARVSRWVPWGESAAGTAAARARAVLPEEKLKTAAWAPDAAAD
jgi:hypothetical protein